MSKKKFSYILSVAALGVSLLAATPAKADVYLYTDADYDYAFSVPDTWTMATPKTPNTRVRFLAPVVDDHAYCEVEVKHDGRFQIYPKRLMGEVVAQNFDATFWDAEVDRRFDDSVIRDIRVTAGLDKGDASMAQVVYDMPKEQAGAYNAGNPESVRMRSVLLASVYGDQRYVMTCGARAEKFSKWSKLFGSVMSSMTLDDRYQIVPTGFYRNFLADKYKGLPHPGLGVAVE